MAVEYIWIQSENGATMMAHQPAPDPKGLFGEEGITFKDVLDIINPLQQLPIIGTIYRELTGDTIKPGARLIGGGIYGLGISGVVSAALSNAIEHATGKDIGGLAIAMVQGESLSDMHAAQSAKNNTQLAAAPVYYSGGADPIDPMWLPPGAKLIDAPVGGLPPSASQYAALTPAQPYNPLATGPQATTAPQATVPDPSVAAAPAPAPVSVAPLPPTINPANSVDESARAPELPSTAGLTGMSTRSRLPTAGAITPAAAGITAAAAQAAMTPTPTGSPMSLAGPQAAAAAAAAEATNRATTAPAAAAKPADGYFAVPQRVNNITPKTPVPQTYANVGTHPLALSNAERRAAAEQIRVSTPPAIAEAPAATNPLGISPAAGAAQVPAAQVPDAMMRALDKYDALMKSRRGGAQVDRNL
jgi:hypothetical protein